MQAAHWRLWWSPPERRPTDWSWAAFHDTEEIVVKPLGCHLKGLEEYAGATILGDGSVALILDVAGLAAKAKLDAVVRHGSRP